VDGAQNIWTRYAVGYLHAMRGSWRGSWIGLGSLLGVACASSPALRQENVATATFAPSLNVDLGSMFHTTSGVYYEDMAIGKGDAARRGSHLTVQYIGWLPDGTMFDRSDPNAPLEVHLGVSHIIKGWDDGLVGMKSGGVRQLIIPPSLGYGDEAIDRIPANSVLVFVIRVLTVK
jgi:FKBP-type peptidyl-prolyl cis-trans isomerase FkpA